MAGKWRADLKVVAVAMSIAMGVLLLGAAPCLAEKYALLVGVGRYPNLPASRQLKGPPQDVVSLRQALERDWGFKPENIQTLVDQEASKRAILDQMRGLAGRPRPGDLVFLYFSGHGTSGRDENSGGLAARIDPTSGALMPYDFATGAPEQMLDKLLIGKRDIRPILETLDKDRVVFAVFDACYSGSTVRRMTRPLQTPSYRFVPLDFVDPTAGESAPASKAGAEAPPYPYTNVIYISASAQAEMARDLPPDQTHDKQPHGALTDALLAGLAGAADANGDGALSYRELHKYAQYNVARRFNHTPQLLYAASNETLLDQPVLGGGRGGFIHRPVPYAENGLRVLCKGLDAELTRTVESVRDVRLARSGEAYDLAVERDADGALFLALPNGYVLTEMTRKSGGKLDADALRERLARQVQIKQLSDLRTQRKGGNVYLSLIGPGGVLQEGTTLGFKVRFEQPSHVLLLNIDPAGMVNVIYPYQQNETDKLPANKYLEFPQLIKVQAPFGTETLVAYAFARKPANFERFTKAEFPATDRLFEDLLHMLETATSDVSEATLQVKTCGRGEIEAGR